MVAAVPLEAAVAAYYAAYYLAVLLIHFGIADFTQNLFRLFFHI